MFSDDVESDMIMMETFDFKGKSRLSKTSGIASGDDIASKYSMFKYSQDSQANIAKLKKNLQTNYLNPHLLVGIFLWIRTGLNDHLRVYMLNITGSPTPPPGGESNKKIFLFDSFEEVKISFLDFVKKNSFNKTNIILNSKLIENPVEFIGYWTILINNIFIEILSEDGEDEDEGGEDDD